ncbi:peptidase M50B-like-domain-containing protein [Rhodotorula diobovata]|uniref:Peptidase M50B-like-domain-containing protein n=1 Tax=Rhodotorula diobovata TaxID=5288 RepID=A0A5C5G095_9BASI|nr:peptidase M50B-like-domain-containing protein [Rhodotorula diobovata]
MSAAGLAPGSLSVLAAPSSLLAAPSGDNGEFGPGDWGWGTDIVTTTLTTDATAHDPELTTTVWTTLGVPGASETTHGTVWVTVYEGSETTLTLTPHVVTLTLSPTSTSLETSTVVEAQTTYETQTALTTTTLQVSSTLAVGPPSATSTPSETLPTTPPPWLTLSTATSATRTRSSSSARPTAAAAPSQSDCEPGDEDEREPGLFSPTEEQALTLLVAGIYALGILVAWNLFGIRHLLYPFKSLTCLVHESGHLVGLLLSAQPLHRFTIDPNLGGATHTVPHPGRTLRPPGLFLGQVASVVFGGLAVFAAFDPLASKYASFVASTPVIMALWLAVIALQANALSRLVCVWPLALLVGIWFIDHASGLRFYVLFLGVMSSFYIIWDTMDDFLHRKQNECCVVMLESNTAVPAFVWLVTWLVTSCAVLAGCVLGALALFRHTEHGMYCRRQGFAPT